MKIETCKGNKLRYFADNKAAKQEQGKSGRNSGVSYSRTHTLAQIRPARTVLSGSERTTWRETASRKNIFASYCVVLFF